MRTCPVCHRRKVNFGIVLGSNGEHSFMLCEVCGRSWIKCFQRYVTPSPANIVHWAAKRARGAARRK